MSPDTHIPEPKPREGEFIGAACVVLGWWSVQLLCLLLFSFAVKCSVCKNVSDTYDPYLDLALEIGVQQQQSGVGRSSAFMGGVPPTAPLLL